MGIYCDYSIEQFANGTFTLIEDNTIDIDSIEEKEWYGSQEISDTIKMLVQVVKQLNKELKEVKEKVNE